MIIWLSTHFGRRWTSCTDILMSWSMYAEVTIVSWWRPAAMDWTRKPPVLSFGTHRHGKFTRWFLTMLTPFIQWNSRRLATTSSLYQKTENLLFLTMTLNLSLVIRPMPEQSRAFPFPWMRNSSSQAAGTKPSRFTQFRKRSQLQSINSSA